MVIILKGKSELLERIQIIDSKTGEKKTDLSLAKHTIDTIAMLQEKTTGNLTEEEQKFTESILADLRWRFVKAKQ